MYVRWYTNYRAIFLLSTGMNARDDQSALWVIIQVKIGRLELSWNISAHSTS